MKTIAPLTGIVLSAAFAATIAQMPRTPAPDGAEVYFQSPLDGDVVTAPFIVRFGLRGIGVAPAGVELPNTGHHHLLIDVTELPSFDLPLPADANHVHFGLGQTETELDLPPGEHTLQLVLGDHLHTPHDPPVMSELITVLVE
ncbi:MAG TPA: DUF4399 domain-containing protein [Gammaproteobacteria bacterium]